MAQPLRSRRELPWEKPESHLTPKKPQFSQVELCEVAEIPMATAPIPRPLYLSAPTSQPSVVLSTFAANLKRLYIGCAVPDELCKCKGRRFVAGVPLLPIRRPLQPALARAHFLFHFFAVRHFRQQSLCFRGLGEIWCGRKACERGREHSVRVGGAAG
jgi:hypothetical protein